MTLLLPDAPCLEHLRNQARALQKAHRAGEPEAQRRVTPFFPAPVPAESPLRLAQAQLVVAREYGFPSWTRLRAHVERLTGPRPAWCRPVSTDPAYYDERALGLLQMVADRLPAALDRLRAALPNVESLSPAEIAARPWNREAGRLVVAREHGFPTWRRFTQYLRALAAGTEVEPFLAACRALEQGAVPVLRNLLDQQPSLARARGANGNTLLHLALGGRPGEAVPLLLQAGADVNAANGYGWTSLHQAAYANRLDTARLLLTAGAGVEHHARGDGGTPLVVALFWGHRAMADLLAEHGVTPVNLRTAAGLGRLDLLEQLLRPDGALAPEAGAHRDFYRPHGGFPDFRPSDAPQEVLDEALTYAARNDRIEAMRRLTAHGADLNVDPYRGTPLLWAAWNGCRAASAWLLEQGALVNHRATFGGPGHGDGVTALHLAVQTNRPEMVRLLLSHGADPTVEDNLFHSSPRGWASHFGHTAVMQLLEAGQQTA